MLGQAHGENQATQLLKRVVPWFALGLLLLYVFSLYGQFSVKQAAWDVESNKPTPSELAAKAAGAAKNQQTITKVPPKPASAASTPKVQVVSDVTLRKDPSTSSDPIRDLKTGETLTFIGQVGPWYKVSDKDGTVAWVSASEKFTKLVDK